MKTADLFRDRKVVFCAATLCCLLWGSAFPAVKTGYVLLAVAKSDIAAQMLFAGCRFVLAGLILLAMALLMRKPILAFDARQTRQLVLLGVVQTTLQYVFFYIGLAHATGVKSSIMNATGAFFSVILAHLFYRNDRLTAQKVAGCVIGFAGVVLVNFKAGAVGLDFTLLGEGFVIIAAFVLAGGSIYGKRLSLTVDPMVMTGYQLAIGGVVLSAIGLVGGGRLGGFTPPAAGLLLYLALLSSIAFALWSIILRYNPVGLVAAFNFLIPVFGVLLSAVFLGETILEWKNALALLLVCAGIWLVTRPRAAIS